MLEQPWELVGGETVERLFDLEIAKHRSDAYRPHGVEDLSSLSDVSALGHFAELACSPERDLPTFWDERPRKHFRLTDFDSDTHAARGHLRTEKMNRQPPATRFDDCCKVAPIGMENGDARINLRSCEIVGRPDCAIGEGPGGICQSVQCSKSRWTIDVGQCLGVVKTFCGPFEFHSRMLAFQESVALS